MPSAPTTYTAVGGPNGTYPGLVVADANKSLAVPVTEFVFSAGGILIPKPVDANNYPYTDIGTPLPTGTNIIGSVGLTGSSTLSSPVTIMQNGATATGAGTPLPVSNYGTAIVDLSISATATVAWQIVGPDGNTYAYQALNLQTGVSSTTTTISGIYLLNVAGQTSLYATVTSLVAGTVTAKGIAQPLPANYQIVDTILQAASGAPGNTAPSRAVLVGGTDGANTRSVLTDSSGRPYTQLYQAPLSTAVVMQNAADAAGLGAGLPVAGYGVAAIDLQITGTATVVWQGVGPGGNTYDLNAKQVGGTAAAPSSTPSSTATTSGLYRVNCAGATTVYANITSWTSGTVTVTGQAQPLTAADSVALDGSNAPLVAAAPTLLATIPYSDFTASGTYYWLPAANLHRNARARTVSVANSMNEPVTAISAGVSDSAAAISLSNVFISGPFPTGSLVNGQTVTDTSERNPILAAHGDTLALSLTMGATAPTSGNVKIYVAELF